MSNHAMHVTYATVCIGSYLQSVMRYKFLGLDVCHLPAPCLCEQGSEDPLVFFEAVRSPREKNSLSNTDLS
jgi:hypothetical protein